MSNQDGTAFGLKFEHIAKVCHEANRAFCQVIGDDTQPSWENAPEWQKNSALNGVKFHIENPTAPASTSHENWMKEKEADGWKYGEVKDAEKKEHPCFVPYEQLPPQQKLKDFIFKGVVHSFMDSGVPASE